MKARVRGPRVPGPRDKLIEIAEDMVAQKGPETFQLQDAANRLGVKSPAIYNHFTGKRDLLNEVARRLGREVAELMADSRGEDPQRTMQSNVRNFVAYLLERPGAARMLLSDLANGSLAAWEDAISLHRENLAALRCALGADATDDALSQITFSQMRAEASLARLATASLRVGADLESHPTRGKQLQDEMANIIIWEALASVHEAG